MNVGKGIPLYTPSHENQLEYGNLFLEIGESLLVPGKLVHKVLSLVLTISRCERGAVFTLDEANRLENPILAGTSANSLNTIRDVCNNFLGEINSRTGMIYVPDTRKDDKFRKISVLKNSDILSFVCLPLFVNEKPHGVLYLDSTLSVQIFSPNDLEKVSRFARFIANAMVNESMQSDRQISLPTVTVDDYLAERSIGELEQQQLQALLEKYNWNVTRTANSLDMPRRTLYNKMAKYQIHRPLRKHKVKSNPG